MATAKKSAGILAYRFSEGILEILLGHPGGPFFSRKDEGVWSIPKGEFYDEEPVAAAKREFYEEIGVLIEGTSFIELMPVIQKGGKTVFAWAVETSVDVTHFKSNYFTMEWPPRSGKFQEFPELDRIEWLTIEMARQKINPAQIPFLDELLQKLNLQSA